MGESDYAEAGEVMDSDRELLTVARGLREMAFVLEEMVEPEDVPPWIDRVAEMPVNGQPFNADFLRWFGAGGFWPERDLADVTGLTIHHTGSHSPLGTARYCTLTKGYPVIQYHWWVSAGDGCPVYLLANPKWAMWHDSTGGRPTTVAIGMAGYWHEQEPSQEQVEALAGLCRYLMDWLKIPVEDVQGHRERWDLRTQCPGWGPVDRREQSWGSGWKSRFYGALAGLG